ncbi:hypothetical protein M9H77_08880 [Catharanthus roseus]|uniref:Uncharacterized protein n=1 Tax=Catharanthus roseus TaxID=4058 RepID=A0ACC0BZ44_CATRO|nr:hypothetical protein M9H77_08880 [Catharanthus roseus]
MYIPLKLEDVQFFLRSLKINGLSGIGGQQSTQEKLPKYLIFCYPVKSIRSGFGCSSDGRDKSHWEHIQIDHTRIKKSSDLVRGSEEGDRDVCLGVEVEAKVGDRAQASDHVGNTIVVGHLADNEHFIALHMKNNFPLPPIYEQWWWWC